MRTPIHRFTEKFKRSQLYYMRFRDLLKIDAEHEKLHKLLKTPQAKLVNPDNGKTLKHPVSTHVVLHPAMRKTLISELEYQHKTAATSDNMIAEDPRNYELYIIEKFERDQQKKRLLERGEKNMNKWVLQFSEGKKKRLSENTKKARQAAYKADSDNNPYPYMEVRGIINMQSEAIAQSEREKGVKIL